MNISRQDSVKKRYIFSLAVNILLCVPRLLMASLVPRSLGPAVYGDYQFLINNFTSIKNFLDLGTSTAFFTYNAKNDQSSHLNFQYLLWWGFQLVIIIAGVILAYIFGVYAHVWPGQDIENIALASVSVWLFLFAQQLVQFGDSKGLTILCQKTNLFANYLAAGLLTLVYFEGLLSIKTAMLIYITGPIVLTSFLTFKLYKNYFAPSGPVLKELSKNYAYFKNYCAPLVTVTIVGFLADFLDRWMLQKFAGSTAQGYYSLSYNWAAIALLFFNPMLNIFWREVAVLAAEKNYRKIGELFSTYSLNMFFITASISFFIAFNSKDIIKIIAGKNFEMAYLPFFIMAFYPLTQIYGQMAGSIYFASEAVSTYRNLSVMLVVFNVLLTYILIAPANLLIPGFSMGVNEYTIKFFCVGLIGPEILIFFMKTKYGIKYSRLLVSRMVIIAFMISLNFINDFWSFCPDRIIINLLVKLSIYSLLLLIIITFYYFNVKKMGEIIDNK